MSGSHCCRMPTGSVLFQLLQGESLISGEIGDGVCTLLNLFSLKSFFCLLIKVTSFEMIMRHYLLLLQTSCV